MTTTYPTIKKHRKPRPFNLTFSPQQQCEKLTKLIQIRAPHALVTSSGTGCFYLLAASYIAVSGARVWARAELLGTTYAEAATALNRVYATALDPERGNSW